jgi:hypothetical protein
MKNQSFCCDIPCGMAIVTSVSEYNNASVFTASSPWTATHSSEMSVNYLPLNIAEHPRRFESLTI